MRFNDITKIFMALWLALLLPGLAHAFGATQCAASRAGSNLGCTANDVQITGISVAGGPASCTGGQNITLDLDLTVQFGSADRYDIGIFISNDGNSPQNLPANGGAASCSVASLPTTSPFLDLDPGPWGGTRDTCGDGNGSIGGGTGSGVLRMTGVSVPCQALASSGKLYIPFVVSWDQSSSKPTSKPGTDICTSSNDLVAGTGSKCNAPTVTQGSVDVVVLPSINKTDGITSITPGDATSYTITLINSTGIVLSTTNSNAAVFKDPAVTNLNVSSVTCLATGGATCPTAATGLTVANMQSASGITIATMPANSTVVFTVNAQLTGNPTGTLTNIATVSSNGQTNSASDTDTIVYPSLVNLKTVSATRDPVNGTSNPKNIPGAEVLYNLRVTNTGAGTVDTNSVVIIDPIPANTELFVGDLSAAGSGPIVFAPGTSALTWVFTSLASLTDDVNFSNNNCTSFSYVPVPTLNYDPAVNCIRLNPKGKLAGASGGSNPYFELRFRVRIK